MRSISILLAAIVMLSLSGCSSQELRDMRREDTADVSTSAAADRSNIIYVEDDAFAEQKIEPIVDAFCVGTDNAVCVSSLAEVPFMVLCRIPQELPEADRTELGMVDTGYREEEREFMYCTPEKTEKWLQDNISPDITLSAIPDIAEYTADDGMILVNDPKFSKYNLNYTISSVFLIQEMEDQLIYLFRTKNPNHVGHGMQTGTKIFMMTFTEDLSVLKVEDVTEKAGWFNNMERIESNIRLNASTPDEDTLYGYMPVYVKQERYCVTDHDGDGKPEVLGTSAVPSVNGPTMLYPIEDFNGDMLINGAVCYDNKSGGYAYVTTKYKYDLSSVTQIITASDLSWNTILEITEYAHDDIYTYTQAGPCCDGITEYYIDGSPAEYEQVSERLDYLSKRFIPVGGEYEFNEFFDMFYEYYGDTWNG